MPRSYAGYAENDNSEAAGGGYGRGPAARPMKAGNGLASRACAPAQLPDGSPQRTLTASDSTMWRALFLALGISMCILGGECLVVEKFVMASEGPPTAQSPATIFGSPPGGVGTAARDVQPAE